jgi:general secretion pathway protein I
VTAARTAAPGRRRARGFSLLELVVAMAIMALALGVLYRAVGGGARTVGDTARYAQAVVLAESVLQTRDAVPEGGWTEEGTASTFRWRVASTPHDPAPDRLALYRVQVDVAWDDGLRERVFSLVTLRPQERSGR